MNPETIIALAGIAAGLIGVRLGHDWAERAERRRRAGDLIREVIISTREFRAALREGLFAQLAAKIHVDTAAPPPEQLGPQREMIEAGKALDAHATQLDAIGFLIDLQLGKRGAALRSKIATLIGLRKLIENPANPPDPDALEQAMGSVHELVSAEVRNVGRRLISDFADEEEPALPGT